MGKGTGDLTSTDQKDLQEKLLNVTKQLKPDCNYLAQYLTVHLPSCEYCQGFFIEILELQRLRKEGLGNQ